VAYLEKKPIQKYPWYIRLIFWAQKKKYGEVLEPTWYWGRSRILMLGLQVFYRCLDRKSNPISPELRALVSNRISQLNHCRFCNDISAKLLLRKGYSEDKIHNLENYEQREDFTPKEKAVIRFAELVTLCHEPISPSELEKLKPFFTDDEIVDLVAWISFQNMSSKFNAALDVPSQGFCKR
jgi:AhpD family alkylhydroperoxidase